MANEAESAPFEGWCIVEQLGHKRLGGYVLEAEIAGHGFLRVDVPMKEGDGNFATQFIEPKSIYCITPCTEEAARIVAKLSQPEPVTRWELPPPRSSSRDESFEEADVFDGPQDDDDEPVF